MSVIQIFLLVAGAVLFVLSFIVPEKGKKTEDSSYLEDRELQSMAQGTLDEAGAKLSEMVEETVQYAMVKSERGLERISNEKIMAVSEYSEAVMADMEKSHKEIIFLYDMLNEKTTALKNSIREAEELRKNIDRSNANLAASVQHQADTASEVDIEAVSEQLLKETEDIVAASAEMVSAASIPDIYGGNVSANKNEKVLALHNEGKSNVAIAKELGLGVGEVKLVIDLFKGAK